MAFLKECVVNDNNRLIVFSENRSKLTLINEDRKTVQKILVDGCQITSGIRCDFLAIKLSVEYYIELKGTDIRHAFSQIEQTMAALSAKGNKKIGFIISVRSPLASAEIQALQFKLRKSFDAILIIRNSPYKHNI